MKQKYIDECKQIQQNCLYTAETHHQIASWNKKLAYSLQIIPAAIAATTATLAASGVNSELLWITVISAVISAITGVLDPNKNYQDHLGAAKNFTLLKHDVRFLHEALNNNMTDESFFNEVRNIHNKYNDLVKVSPPTTEWAFKKAQKIISAGTHDPDKDKDGNIK